MDKRGYKPYPKSGKYHNYSLGVQLNNIGMDINPYQAPFHLELTSESTADTIRKIKGPSTGLIVLLAIQIIVYVLAALLLVATLIKGYPPRASPIEISLALAHFATMLFMLRSMLHIRLLRHLQSGRIAAGLACIPMVTPWIWFGIPFGIWLSVLLARSTTNDAFAKGFQNGG